MLLASLHEQEIRRVIGVLGTGDRSVDGIAPLEEDQNQCLYFVNRTLTPEVRSALATRHGCIVIAPTGSGLAEELGACTVLEVGDPRAAIAKVLGFIRDEARYPALVSTRQIAASASISPLALVEGNVEIGEGVVIEPFCMVGPDVRIGCGSFLGSGVRLYPRVKIGNHSTVGSNSVIGHQGFGFVRNEIGDQTRMPHLGGVVIGSHVEIGVVSTIQSGTIEPTTIEDHAKIAEHVAVGHNVRIARGVRITGGVMVGGHATIEEAAWVGLNSSIREGRRVGGYSLVGMGVSLQQDLPDRTVARAPRADVRARSQDETP